MIYCACSCNNYTKIVPIFGYKFKNWIRLWISSLIYFTLEICDYTYYHRHKALAFFAPYNSFIGIVVFYLLLQSTRMHTANKVHGEGSNYSLGYCLVVTILHKKLNCTKLLWNISLQLTYKRNTFEVSFPLINS